jgi:hypothetical protein
VHVRVAPAHALARVLHTAAASRSFAQVCAVAMSRNLSGVMDTDVPPPPALLVTDNAVLRYAVHAGLLVGLVGPSRSAVHTSRGTPSDVDVWSTYVRLPQAACPCAAPDTAAAAAGGAGAFS